MSINAADVKILRDKTGAGMMDCKKALTEADGDFEKAIEILRKKGASVAAKRAERSAKEGIILTKIWNDGTDAVILDVNCETDFVANSDDFKKFAETVQQIIIDKKPSNLEELLSIENPNISTLLNETTGKIGEKIEISRFALDKCENGFFVDYIHPGANLGVLIKVENASKSNTSLVSLIKDITMQIAAMNPQFLTKEEVPLELIEKEKEIYKELLRKEGKPEQMLEKIADGKISKFYSEVCLVDQIFVKDNSKTVGQLLSEFNKQNALNAKLSKFYRFHVADEKK